MQFSELIKEGKNFHLEEIEKIREYVRNNNGRIHQIPNSANIHLSFHEGSFRKITVIKGDRTYSMIMGNTTRHFPDFNSLVEFLENNT
jgi:hypothetical protein